MTGEISGERARRVVIGASDGSGGFVEGGGGTFTPSQDFISDLTMNGTAQAIALDSATSGVTVWNQGATTEDIRYAFGTSAANAQAGLTHVTNRATTGVIVPAYSDYAQLCFVTVKVPSNATHIAVENAVASDTQAVQLVQGKV